jgi:hypothetical protein
MTPILAGRRKHGDITNEFRCAIGKTGRMPIQTVSRRWTIATWLVAGHGGQIETIDHAIEDLSCDAMLLQSIRESDVQPLAAGLGFHHVWALSHYRRSRLIRGSGVGLAVMTPHRIVDSFDVVVGDHRSTWSTDRRIAQTVSIERTDHSSYQFSHAVVPVTVFASQPNGAPAISVHPARIDSDPAGAIELPEQATVVSRTVDRPITGVAQLVSVTFEMPWVQGDFPTPEFTH